MRRTFCALLFLLGPPSAQAAGELLRQVQESNRQAAQQNQQREARFSQVREREADALRRLQSDLNRQQGRVASAKKRWETARRVSAQLEQDLKLQGRNLETLYDAVRGAAVDLHDRAARSDVTAQFPGRLEQLAPLAASSTLPGPKQLELLWHALRDEMQQSGAVVTFPANVHTPQGPESRELWRAGVFALFDAENFYRMSADGRGVLAFERAPARRFRSLAREFVMGSGVQVPMVLDPSLGALLLADASRPGLFDRLWSSGVGGYFIAGILALAVLLLILQSAWLRTRLILDEQSIALTVAILLAFALVQWWLWTPRAPTSDEDQVAVVDLLTEEDLLQPDEPPPPEIEPPPPPPDVPVSSATTALAGLPALAAPTSAPLLSNIQIPVKISGGGSLKGLGFGGFARGSGQGAGAAGIGRGAGFKGKELIPLSTARPQMPEWACKQYIKGWVEAVFTVLPNGRVQDVKIVDAEPRGVYELAAIESISNWIYAETDKAREVKQRVPMDPADCAFNWQ